MIIDSKGKLFGKISIIDILIIAVVLAAVAGVGYKFSKSKTLTPLNKQDVYEIMLYTDETYDYVPKQVKVGDIVKDRVQNSVLGTVKDIKTDKAISWNPDANGKQVKSSKEGYNSVVLTVEVKATDNINGITIGSSTYQVGKGVETMAGDCIMIMRIMKIEKKG